MYNIQNVLEALESETLSQALFKLESVAKSQGLEEISRWALLELEGYTDQAPSYRQVDFREEDDIGNTVKSSTQYLLEGVRELENTDEEGLLKLNPLLGQSTFNNSLIKQFGYFRKVVEHKEIKLVLQRIHDEALRLIQKNFSTASLQYSPYPCPDFSALVNDSELARILTHLWQEANLTFKTEAYLATIILLGSILEGVLMFKVQENPSQANQALSAPKDKGKVLPFDKWMLGDLIKVTYECGWFRKDTKDVFELLQQYRNLVHPRKQMQDKFQPDKSTCEMAWPVLKPALDALKNHHCSITSPST